MGKAIRCVISVKNEWGKYRDLEREFWTRGAMDKYIDKMQEDGNTKVIGITEYDQDNNPIE